MVLLSTEGRIDNLLEKTTEMHDFKQLSKKEIAHGKQKEVIIVFIRRSD